ncbi:MAG: hypothetical protein KDD59_08205 [Bdellovibrionales bacterium]|nr:hypothetical protein [Bdellovibrionales bacterium]
MRRLILWVVVGFFVLLITGIVGLALYISSEAGSERLFAELVSVVQQKTGVHIKSQRPRLSLFGGVEVNNFAVTHEVSGQMKLEAFAERLYLRIQPLSVFRSSVVVESLEADALTLDVSLFSSEKTAADEAPGGEPLPLGVVLKNLDLNRMNIMATLKVDDPQSHWEIKNAKVNGSLTFLGQRPVIQGWSGTLLFAADGIASPLIQFRPRQVNLEIISAEDTHRMSFDVALNDVHSFGYGLNDVSASGQVLLDETWPVEAKVAARSVRGPHLVGENDFSTDMKMTWAPLAKKLDAQGSLFVDGHTAIENLNLKADLSTKTFNASASMSVYLKDDWVRRFQPTHDLPLSVDKVLPTPVELQLSVQQNAVTSTLGVVGEAQFSKVVVPQKGLVTDVKWSFQGDAEFSKDGSPKLFNFDSTVAHKETALIAKGLVAWERGDLQGQGDLTLAFPEFYEVMDGHKIKGGVHIPWTVRLESKHELFLETQVVLGGLQLQSKDYGIDGLNGVVRVSEHLKIKPSGVELASTVVPNPFSRVEYGRVEPLFENVVPIVIDRVRWQKHEFGPFIGYFSLVQNLFAIHEFDLEVGDGELVGEFYFDGRSNQQQIGLLTRAIEIDLNRLFPRFATAKNQNDNQISGRAGLVVDIAQKNLEGRADITQIGAPPLVTMMNVLDPEFEDEQFNKARYALSLAYPSLVMTDFRQGYMNMDVQLSGALNHRFKFRGIPMGTLFSQMAFGDKNNKKETP